MIGRTIKKKNIIFSIGFLLLLFLWAIGTMKVGGIAHFVARHFDELFTLVLTAYVLYHYKMIIRKRKKLIVLQIMFNAIGIISSIVFHYQGIVATLVDFALLVNRFLVAYYAAVVFSRIHKYNISRRVITVAKIVTVLLFVLSIHDIVFTPFFKKGDYRIFMYGLQLMFPHSTYMAAAASTLLVYFGYVNDSRNRLFPYMIMSSLLICFTMRTKAIGFTLIYWFFYFETFVMKKRRYFITILVSLVAVLLIAKDSFRDHFLNSSRYMPRMIMLKDGLKLMLSHFPLGTGFGSYGSAVAASYYSPLYTALGYISNYGMGPENTSFLTDAFWPTVFAQFGLVGSLFFIIIIVELLGSSMKMIKMNKKRGFSMLMVLAYYLITSIAESAFFNPTAILMFMMFGMFEEEERCNISTGTGQFLDLYEVGSGV